MGNQTAVTTNGVTQTKTQNAQNQTTSADGNNLAYDANGATTTDEQGRHWTYDAWGDPISVTNSSAIAGDEVVEAYLKTPEANGPVRSLAAFQRVRLQAGETREVALHLDPRALSSVDEKGERSILPGKYELTLAGAQPEEAKAKSEATFTVTGTQPLPR